MKKTFIIGAILLFLITVTLSSCGGTKKCNGNRGIKTPMGTM